MSHKLPIYCWATLLAPVTLVISTNGEERAATARGPRKLRGTTPGNSKWSY